MGEKETKRGSEVQQNSQTNEQECRTLKSLHVVLDQSQQNGSLEKYAPTLYYEEERTRNSRSIRVVGGLRLYGASP